MKIHKIKYASEESHSHIVFYDFLTYDSAVGFFSHPFDPSDLMNINKVYLGKVFDIPVLLDTYKRWDVIK